jgi:hypothetical protein
MDEYPKVPELEWMNASVQLAALSAALPDSSPQLRKRILAVLAMGEGSTWSHASWAALALRETDWSAISLILGRAFGLCQTEIRRMDPAEIISLVGKALNDSEQIAGDMPCCSMVRPKEPRLELIPRIQWPA